MSGLGRGFDALIPTDLVDEEFDLTALEDKKSSELKQIKIKEILSDGSERKHVLTCKPVENQLDDVDLNDMGCLDLKNYAINIGGTCVVFYAEEGGKEYLVKKIMYKYGTEV